MSKKYNKILIVDDEEDLSWSISKSLKRNNEMIDVTCVNRGDEASKLLKSRSFDLVISDIRMPGKSGLELLDEIRTNNSNTSVILMTAYGSQEIENKLRTINNVKYIEKPFDIHDLKRMVFGNDMSDEKISPVIPDSVYMGIR